MTPWKRFVLRGVIAAVIGAAAIGSFLISRQRKPAAPISSAPVVYSLSDKQLAKMQALMKKQNGYITQEQADAIARDVGK